MQEMDAVGAESLCFPIGNQNCEKGAGDETQEVLRCFRLCSDGFVLVLGSHGRVVSVMSLGDTSAPGEGPGGVPSTTD